MASNAPTECGICHEVYNDNEHCPRILPCNHYLCTLCIKQLIQLNRKSCPFCRRNFEAESYQNLQINNGILDLLQFFLKSDSHITSPHTGESKQLSQIIVEFREQNKQTSEDNLAECNTATNRISTAIRNNLELKEYLFQINKKFAEKILIKMNGIYEKNRQKIMHLEEENERLKSQLEKILAQAELIKDMDAELKEASDFTVAAPIMNMAEKNNHKMKKCLKDLKDFLSEDEKIRLSIRKTAEMTVRKITLLQEGLTPSDGEDEEDIDLSSGIVSLMIQCADPEEVTVDFLRRMSDSVKTLIHQGRIFAFQELQGKRRYARISNNENGQLCLHHLKEKKCLPTNVRLIKFDDVMSMVDINGRRIFLELGGRGSSLGRLRIRLIDDVDNKFAYNYFLLCTGEMGPSYANSSIFNMIQQGNMTQPGHTHYEMASMGDYEHNNGRGGAALLTGVDWGREMEKKHYIRPCVKGTVTAQHNTRVNFSQFNIYTKDYPGSRLPGCIGVVEAGLSVLTEAMSKHPNGREIYISDCGIILPL